MAPGLRWISFALLWLAIAVNGDDWTQSICSDPACSENCFSTTFIQGNCYPTEVAGTSARVWCADNGAVIKTELFPESGNCSAFSYFNKEPSNVCTTGQFNYVIDTCGSSSSNPVKSEEGDPMANRVRLRLLVRPAAAALANMTRDHTRLAKQGNVEVSLGRGLDDPIVLRLFPLPGGLAITNEKKHRLRVRFASIRPVSTSLKRNPRFESLRAEKGVYVGFSQPKSVTGVVLVQPGGRSVVIHKRPLLAFLENNGWSLRRPGEVVFFDEDRNEVFSLWVRSV